MADPISSLNRNSSNSCIDGTNEGEASAPVASTQSAAPVAAPNQCLPEAAPSAPSATRSLVDKFPAAGSTSVAATGAPSSGTPVTASGGFLVTSSGTVHGGSSHRVAGSLLHGELKSGIFSGTADVGTASVQTGVDTDVQVAAERYTGVVSHGGYSLSVTVDSAAARANLGQNNDDGSLGGNLGASAELGGVEGTLNTPVGSITYGNSLSIGASGSMGVRDQDHDGKPEFCAKFSIPAYTLGACVEQFW